MGLNVEVTLNAATWQRFNETAKRLASLSFDDDGLLEAAFLLRVARYERATNVTSRSLLINGLNAEHNE
jgi:hypothetical protein